MWNDSGVALTQQVKSELATVRVLRPETRAAEVVAMVRFSGGLHLVSGQIVIEAELDTGAAARRLRKAITDLYGFESELMVISASGIRRGNRYVLRLVRDGEAFARQTGLIDRLAAKYPRRPAMLEELAAIKNKLMKINRKGI